jgi:hypothetical protein
LSNAVMQRCGCATVSQMAFDLEQSTWLEQRIA